MPAEHPAQSGISVLSSRSLDLEARLHYAGVEAHFLVTQSPAGGIQLPSMDPPLLLDTHGLGFIQSAALLIELAKLRPVIPTIALVDPDDVALRVILRICPAIYAVLADTEDLRLLGPLLRLGGLCGSARLRDVAPCWSGVPPVQREVLSLEELEVLVVLAQSDNIDAAVAQSSLLRRTFYRRLARLRVGLGLPRPTHGMRTDELVAAMITALSSLGQLSTDNPLP